MPQWAGHQTVVLTVTVHVFCELDRFRTGRTQWLSSLNQQSGAHGLISLSADGPNCTTLVPGGCAAPDTYLGNIYAPRYNAKGQLMASGSLLKPTGGSGGDFAVSEADRELSFAVSLYRIVAVCLLQKSTISLFMRDSKMQTWSHRLA